MRSAAVAVVTLVAAVLGGASALVVAKAAGWLGDGRVTTVVIRSPAPSPSEAAPRTEPSSAKPLPGNGFDPARIYAERSPGVVTIFARLEAPGSFGIAESQGSGFVVSSSGYILTNSHVITTAGEGDEGSAIRAAVELYVAFEDGDRVPASVVGWDSFNDVGLIKVDPKTHRLSPLPLGDSSGVVVGEPVAAIGSPFGNENSLAVGVVSATRRSIASLISSYSVVDAIQTDAPINRGNSGGPLLDARGRVIGINAQIRSESGNAEGVGFAIPINSAKRSLEQLLATGRVTYAYVGISTDDLTPTLARRFGYKVLQGALVSAVEPGGPGQTAGLRGCTRGAEFNGRSLTLGGDVIVAIDGRPVRSSDDVARIMGRLLPGETARFSIVRGGVRKTLRVKLAERPLDSRPLARNC